MSALEVDAEVQRIARLLRVNPSELQYLLEGVPAADLRGVRDQITDVLFAPNTMLERIAAATKLVPVPVGASIGEKVFGPVIVSRLVPLLDVDKAVEMGARLPVPFLADVATELDPRRVKPLLARISREQVVAVTKEMVARKEYIALGSYVASLPDDSLRDAMKVYDPEDLVRQALVIEQKDRLAHVYELIGDDALKGMVAKAKELGFVEQIRELMQYLTPDQRAVAESELGAKARG